MVLNGVNYSSRFANCTLQDDSIVLQLPPGLDESIEVCKSAYMLESDDDIPEWMNELDFGTNCLSDYKDNVLIYIAGNIEKKVICREKCIECIEDIQSMERMSSDLLNIKNRGGLTIPSNDIVKIVKICYRDILL